MLSGASQILCKRSNAVQIEQIISRERSRVQGARSLGVILATEMPRVKDQPLNPASCRKTNYELCIDHAPVLASARPFFRNVHHRHSIFSRLSSVGKTDVALGISCPTAGQMPPVLPIQQPRPQLHMLLSSLPSMLSDPCRKHIWCNCGSGE